MFIMILDLVGSGVDKTAVVRALAQVHFQPVKPHSKSCSPESLGFLLPQKSTSPNFNVTRIEEPDERNIVIPRK